MAARVFLLSILFTEVLRPACLAGVRGVSSGVGVPNVSKYENSENQRNGGLNIRLDIEPSGNVTVGRRKVSLRCSAGPNHNISWYRDGRAAPPCGSLWCNVTPTGVLQLKLPKHGERENKNIANDKIPIPESYRCVAKYNGSLLRSSPTFVQISYLSHEFNQSPQNVSVREGELARFSCSINSIPFPANITWQRENRSLSLTDKTKYFMVSPGVLYINATKSSDAGSYRCLASNEISKKKTKISKEAWLNVDSTRKGINLHTPRPKLFPQISYDYKIIVGSDLALVCASSGFPFSVMWKFVPELRDGATGIRQQPRVLLNSTNSIVILKLKRIKVSDAGSYQCSVESFEKILQIQTITVDVLVPPTFLEIPENRSIPSGRMTRFDCQAQGRPMPEIYWLKNSKKLEITSRQRTYTEENGKTELVISSAIPNDAGIYQCIALNSAGEIWSAGALKVNYSSLSPPIATSLNCRPLSSDRILLSWKLPEQTISSSNIASYVTVHYASAEPGSWEDPLVTEINPSCLEVPSLKPFTNYTMYVRVWNIHGASNQSAHVQCSTAESVPMAIPKVIVQPITSTKLNVSWQPLERKEARGNIVEYKLQWRNKDQISSRVRNVSASVNQYTISDLVPGTHYEVRVLARTKLGWPNISDSQLNWTGVIMPLTNFSKSPLTKLVDLDVIDVDESTVKVVWKFSKEAAVGQERNFDAWKLYYQNGAGKKLLNSLPKNSTEYMVNRTDIEAGTSYGIELCIVRSGEPDTCFSKQRPSSKVIDDHAVTDLEGNPVSSTSINVSWSSVSPKFEYFYEVCYRPAYSTDLEGLRCSNTTSTTILVGFLKPYTLYQFKVTDLYNKAELGRLYSETIECYTDEDVPGSVREIDWFLSNLTEVRVAWKQPVELNGVIRNYTVSYTKAPSSTPTEYWTNLTVPGIKTNINIPGLAQGTLYFLEIRAATSAGYGKVSARIMFQTGDPPTNVSTPDRDTKPSPNPLSDQSLGIIVGVSISTFCIVICLSSIYCRKRWERIQSTRETSLSLKDRVIFRNGNGCCTERNSISIHQHVSTTSVMNEIESTVLYQPSPKISNSRFFLQDGRLNGIIESCAEEPLLISGDINGESKDLNITENPRYNPRNSVGSNQQLQQELDGTQLTTLNYTLASSCSSLNNNFEVSESLSPLQQAPSSSVPVIAPNG